VKKWLITLLAALAFLLLTITWHVWAPQVLQFATNHKEPVESLNTLAELFEKLVMWPATVILFIFSLWQKRRENSKTNTSQITNQHADRDINAPGRNLQNGGVNLESGAKVKGNVAGGNQVVTKGDSFFGNTSGTVIKAEQVTIYQSAIPADASSVNPLPRIPPPPTDFTGGSANPAEDLCMGCMDERKADRCQTCGWIEGSPALLYEQLSPRTILLNRYLLGKALGQGTFGITYLAWDLADERKIAIKEYFPKSVAARATGQPTVLPLAGERGALFDVGLRRFSLEARDLKRLGNRAGLVMVLRAFEANGTGYMVMDLLDGGTLEKRVRDAPRGRLSFQETLTILAAPMEVLTELHKFGLYHLDISPAHVNVTGTLGKLLDFGGAKRAAKSSGLTIEIVDSKYHAYEQLGNSPQGASTDVYGLAATFYFCLTGTVPSSPADRSYKDDLRVPHDLGASLPPQAERAILRALSVNPEKRYQKVEEFRRDIDPSISDIRGETSADGDLRPRPSFVQIFLCHSKLDRLAARQLYRLLRNDGIDPWLGEDEILPGEDRDKEIISAVRKSNLMIVCLSRQSVDQMGCVDKDIQFALDVADEKPRDTIYIIPARLDEDVKVPDYLQSPVNLFEDGGYEKLMRAINKVRNTAQRSIS